MSSEGRRIDAGSGTLGAPGLPMAPAQRILAEETLVSKNADKRVVASITALMDVVLVLAVLLLARLIIGFFQALAISQIGGWYLELTSRLVPPIAGGWAVRSPNSGVFSVDTGIVIVLLLIVEWLLARARRRLEDDAADTEG
jgi:hypothetical protein